MEDFELFQEGDLEVIEEDEVGGGAIPPLRVLMVIAHQFFRDEEYLYPRAIFDEHNCVVTVCSNERGMCGGVMEAQVLAEVDFKEAAQMAFDNPYNAVVFCGGQGTEEYYDDPDAHMLARIAAKKSDVLGAICVAPTILAKAGLLTGRKVTAFPTCRRNLEMEGVDFVKPKNSTDCIVMVQETKYADIVTGSGPIASKKFGEKIMEILLEKQQERIQAALEAAKAAAEAEEKEEVEKDDIKIVKFEEEKGSLEVIEEEEIEEDAE